MFLTIIHRYLSSSLLHTSMNEIDKYEIVSIEMFAKTCKSVTFEVFVKHDITHNHPKPTPKSRLTVQADRVRRTDSTNIHNHPNGCKIREISDKHQFFQPTITQSHPKSPKTIQNHPYFLPGSRSHRVKYIAKISNFYNVV